jgi:hypothetical protein
VLTQECDAMTSCGLQVAGCKVQGVGNQKMI